MAHDAELEDRVGSWLPNENNFASKKSLAVGCLLNGNMFVGVRMRN
jgi:hypothetical protein